MRSDMPTPTPISIKPIVTCEHGGNQIPDEYRALFANHRELLETHRGFDFGALKLAEQMATALDAPMFASTTSRLLVDLNRSVGNPSLHSEPTRHLSAAQRARIVDTYWRPYRTKVESFVQALINSSAQVVHIASHSFTPELNGQVRKADVGLLYDPRRTGELAFAAIWKSALSGARPDLRVRLNYPYAGKGDGLTNTLRRAHPADRYVGIEFELNQRCLEGSPQVLGKLRDDVVASLRLALSRFAKGSI